MRHEKEPKETWRKGRGDLAPGGYAMLSEEDVLLQKRFKAICERLRAVNEYSGKTEMSKIIFKLNEICDEKGWGGKITNSDGSWFLKGFMRNVMRAPLKVWLDRRENEVIAMEKAKKKVSEEI